jgi:hypothetical protein
LKAFFAASVGVAGQARTIGISSALSCGGAERAYRGAIYRRNSDPGRRFSTGLIGGPKLANGIGCSRAKRTRPAQHDQDLYKARSAIEAYEVALGEAKELVVALDCVEIDGYAPSEEITACQDLADRICAMLTKLIRSAEAQSS